MSIRLYQHLKKNPWRKFIGSDAPAVLVGLTELKRNFPDGGKENFPNGNFLNFTLANDETGARFTLEIPKAEIEDLIKKLQDAAKYI